MRGAVEPGRWRSASPGRGGGAAGATRAMAPPRSGPSNGAPGPPCHHPRHCIGCACQILSVTPSNRGAGGRSPDDVDGACQILSVTPSNRGAGDRGRPGRRRRPTGRARQRRSRGAYQPQRGPTLRAKRPPWRARRSTPAACHARSTTPPPPPSDSHWRRGIRRAHIPMPTLHTLAHAPPAAQGRPLPPPSSESKP